MMVACEETVGLSNNFFMDNLTNKTLDGPWKTLSKHSPFAIHKGVNGIAGGEISIKRQFSGVIYLTCSKKSQSYSLLKCVLFGVVAPVAVTAHKSLNSSK